MELQSGSQDKQESHLLRFAFSRRDVAEPERARNRDFAGDGQGRNAEQRFHVCVHNGGFPSAELCAGQHRHQFHCHAVIHPQILHSGNQRCVQSFHREQTIRNGHVIREGRLRVLPGSERLDGRHPHIESQRGSGAVPEESARGQLLQRDQFRVGEREDVRQQSEIRFEQDPGGSEEGQGDGRQHGRN